MHNVFSCLQNLWIYVKKICHVVNKISKLNQKYKACWNIYIEQGPSFRYPILWTNLCSFAKYFETSRINIKRIENDSWRVRLIDVPTIFRNVQSLPIDNCPLKYWLYDIYGLEHINENPITNTVVYFVPADSCRISILMYFFVT